MQDADVTSIFSTTRSFSRSNMSTAEDPRGFYDPYGLKIIANAAHALILAFGPPITQAPLTLHAQLAVCCVFEKPVIFITSDRESFDREKRLLPALDAVKLVGVVYQNEHEDGGEMRTFEILDAVPDADVAEQRRLLEKYVPRGYGPWKMCENTPQVVFFYCQTCHGQRFPLKDWLNLSMESDMAFSRTTCKKCPDARQPEVRSMFLQRPLASVPFPLFGGKLMRHLI